MRKLLLFFTLFLAAVVAKAATISGDGISGATDNSSGNKVQTLNVSTPGALATWVANHTGDNYDTNNPFEGLGGSDDFYSLTITGTLNAADLAALDAAKCGAFSRFPRIDMSGVTLADDVTSAEVCAVNFGTGSFDKNGTTISGTGATYIRLPNSMTSADDVAQMAKMQDDGNNANLKVVASCDNSNASIPEMAVYSFSENKLSTAKSTFADMPWESTKIVRMAGSFGDNDLIDHVNEDRPIWGFGGGAVWDFTGASFSTITIDASTLVNRGPYYASNDPFEDNGVVTPLSSSYTTNAFYYFMNYATKVVDIKLPTGITELPPSCLLRMGEENVANYRLINNISDEDFQTLSDEISEQMRGFNKEYTGAWIPIEQLVIPDNIVTIGWECCVQSVLKNVVLGTSVKDVQGGAFKLNVMLENLDCKTGISGCRLGDQAFNECNSMKHIVLSEGIISLGANCFNNSQHLESIRLPETLEAIGNYCFKDGHALSTITIPATVSKIGMGAFTLTALTDIYLMAENPEDVPVIYTAGSDWGDEKSTFSKNTMESNNTLNWDGNGNFNGKTSKKVNEMTFDEAAAAYFAYCNRMAALHFSPNVAEVVLAEISSYYGCTSTDGYGIPVMQTGDSDKRGNAMGLQNMGGTGSDGGIYTKYGWAQFLIQKEFTPDHPEVFTKEYDDVWNTMCFPFDLTDEQLATAFNEGFNIVDFSGVEIQDETQSSDGKLTLILHFNTVAKTIYKDAEGNVYTVIGREPDGKFDYNVYQRDGKTYKHVSVGSGGTGYKTKTFAENGDANNGVIEIDGILASAGHPYMVHPNTGTNTGMPLTRCHFAGISWKPADTWETLFDNEKRVVDLTEAKGNLDAGTPDADNYLQAAYSNYSGTYTFIGNPKELKEGAPAEPTDQYQSYPPYPTLDSYPPEPSLERGDEPQPPTDPTSTVGARMTEADAPTPVANPADDTETYPTAFQTLFSTVRCTGLDYSTNPATEVNYTYGNDLVAGNFGEFFWGQVGNSGDPLRYATNANLHSYISCDYTALENYLGSADQNDIQDKFNALKTLASNFTSAKPAYDAYLVELQAYQDNIDAWNQYDRDYTQYLADHEAWLNWTAEGAQSAHDAWEQECEEIDGRNAPLISQYNTDCANVDRYNKGIKDAWEASLAAYKRLIPKGAYFLGRKGRGWPKYYREIAEEDRENPTGGFWTQYTAIIIPDATAIAGIEAELDGTSSQGANQSVEMVFDEGFTGDFVTTDEIEQIVADAEEKGQKVEYMRVVYNINGQIVREGTSLEGLPKGFYIVNGKKYFVK